MKQSRYTLLLVALVSIAQIKIQAQQLLTLEELNKNLTSFYQKPDPSVLQSIINTILVDKKVRESFPPRAFLGFCTGIILSRNENSRLITGELEKHRTESKLFETILTLGQTQDTLKNWNEHSADANDMMWSAYFGTGETKYLDRLLSETRFKDREDSLQLFFAGASAMWSSASNAQQHPAIKQYFEKSWVYRCCSKTTNIWSCHHLFGFKKIV